MAERTKSTSLRSAWRFVALMGIVSLFADMTYEGARSLTGQFLALLGAGAAVIGIVAGMGEFLGYAFRLAAGIVADRTGRYWGLTFLGYAVNVLSVPTLALAGRWAKPFGHLPAMRCSPMPPRKWGGDLPSASTKPLTNLALSSDRC
jgi:hypothetical protein